VRTFQSVTTLSRCCANPESAVAAHDPSSGVSQNEAGMRQMLPLSLSAALDPATAARS
jgi:hypothetical protein